VKLAVVLFNLGGPDSLEAVEPFLTNLFSDPAVISLPAFLRLPLARLIAKKRDRSPARFTPRLAAARPFCRKRWRRPRRCNTPSANTKPLFHCHAMLETVHEEAARAIAAWSPDNIVLLPLYPQFSTTTTGSALDEWRRAARVLGIAAPTTTICCYPRLAGFIEGLAGATRDTLAQAKPGISYRVLISAHGLPKRVIARGDPYQVQVEQTAAALVDQLGITDWTICYQSRVGPLEWIGPSTDAEIRPRRSRGQGCGDRAGGVVSEHSETLVELDIEYAKLAREAGVPDYLRVPTVSVRGEFIAGLAGLVRESLAGGVSPRFVRHPAQLAAKCEAMKTVLLDYYLLIKALHIIAVIAWMSGMFYLPRLFVYHTETVPGAVDYQRFCTMERKPVAIHHVASAGSDVDLRPHHGLAQQLVVRWLVPDETRPGGWSQLGSPHQCSVRPGFCRRQECTNGAVFPLLERATDPVHDRHRHFGGDESILIAPRLL